MGFLYRDWGVSIVIRKHCDFSRQTIIETGILIPTTFGDILQIINNIHGGKLCSAQY